MACFFVEPWKQLAAELKPAAQAWLLSEAAFRLRALNRLAEAREPMRATIELYTQQSEWKYAAITSGNLSELELTLGDVRAAEATAAESVTFADRSGDEFMRMAMRTTHADALHQAGRVEDSRRLFAEAETMQAAWQPDYPLLYSLQGYQYCDLLLAAAERAAWQRFRVGWDPSPDARSARVSDPAETPDRRSPDSADDAGDLRSRPVARSETGHNATAALAEVERRATTALGIAMNPNLGLLSIALDHLTLGRVQLLGLVLGWPAADRARARTELDTALAKLREGNRGDHLPRALLPSAWLHALEGQWDAARQRLDEAYGLATRGGTEGSMKLHLIDTLLHRARLFGIRQQEGAAMPDYPWPGRTPQQDLDEAAALIDSCGYHRRDAHLAAARAALP